MPGGLTSVFGDFDDFQAAMSAEGVVGLLATGCGRFRARLTQLTLHRLWLAAGEEEMSRIAFIAVPPTCVLVSFPIGRAPSPVWGAIGAQAGEIITIAAGQRMHARSVGPCRWGTIRVLEQDLILYGRALIGTSFRIPPGIARWRPAPPTERALLQLHRAAIRMAEVRLPALADPAAAYGLEQQLLHALIDCMAAGRIEQETPATRRHRGLVVRFEELLQAGAFQSTADLCAMLGVSERLLRKCASELLGIALNRYLRLRRMQQVHGALRNVNPKSTTVSEIAGRHGFHDLGRFASNYRAVYGELPSATLRRHPSKDAAKLTRSWPRMTFT